MTQKNIDTFHVKLKTKKQLLYLEDPNHGEVLDYVLVGNACHTQLYAWLIFLSSYLQMDIGDMNAVLVHAQVVAGLHGMLAYDRQPHELIWYRNDNNCNGTFHFSYVEFPYDVPRPTRIQF